MAARLRTRAAWTQRHAQCLARQQAWMARYDQLPAPRPPALGARLLRRVAYWQAAADQATAVLAVLPRPERFGWSSDEGLTLRHADGTLVD